LLKRNLATGKTTESRSVFVDSSAWIALFSRQDQNHEAADRAFRSIIIAKRRMITTNLILAEIHLLLLHRAGIRAAAVALEKIEASPLVELQFTDSNHHQSALAWMRKMNGRPITYTDAASFAVMEAMGSGEALSYDHHFQAAGFRTV
jgi:uncharacterized protein